MIDKSTAQGMSSTDLFRALRGVLHSSGPGVDVCSALDELEERWHSGRTGNPAARVTIENECRHRRGTDNKGQCVDCGETVMIVDHVVLARLAQVEEDLTAFKREHDEHRHITLGDSGIGTSRPTCNETVTMVGVETGREYEIPKSAIEALRTNAENRAWQCFEDWRALANKNDMGNVYEVRIKPPHETQTQWHASIHVEYSTSGYRLLVIEKRGASRIDALAHLASWCQAEMP